MTVNKGPFRGQPFINHAMELRGTQTERGAGRTSIVYPRRKFTFIVEFVFNPIAIDPTRMSTNLLEFITNGRLYSTLKSIDHPKPRLDTEKIRSYNKDVILPKKMEYDPASIGFHDDNTSMAAALWQEYRAFYQYEGRLGQRGGPVGPGAAGYRISSPLTDAAMRTTGDIHPSMGMTLKTNEGRHCFDSIIIYDLGADPDAVNIYTYLYPVITGLDHDALDYEDTPGLVSMNFSFDYEGYYQQTGLNNNQFHGKLERYLGFAPFENSGNVPGHARPIQNRGSELPINNVDSPNVNFNGGGGTVATPSRGIEVSPLGPPAPNPNNDPTGFSREQILRTLALVNGG